MTPAIWPPVRQIKTLPGPEFQLPAKFNLSGIPEKIATDALRH